MSKQEEPLNEVSLNTPAGKLHNLPFRSSKKQQMISCSKKNIFRPESKTNIIASTQQDHHFEHVSAYLKEKKLSKERIELIHQSLRILYEDLINVHMVSHVRLLVKQHLMFIVNILNENEPTYAEKEILHLYNQTNFQNINDLHGILLADYTSCNSSYLSTLKILAMQVILKTKTAKKYQASIIRLFSIDQRYILKDPKLKIHTIIKFILNFFSALPSFKLLFGLKFLQYIKQFNLRFEHYITNMDYSAFERQLVHYASENFSVCACHVSSFYLQYSKYNQTPEKIMLADLVLQGEIMSKGPANANLDLIALADEANLIIINSTLLTEEISSLLDATSKFLQCKVLSLPKVLRILEYVWDIIRHDGQSNKKEKVRLLDETLIFVNSSIRKLGRDNKDFLNLLQALSEYCIDSEELKRLTNIINVLFNSFVVTKHFAYLLLAAKLETSRYLFDKDSKNVRPVLERFEKFISSTSDLQEKSEIFSHIFNIHFTFCDESFPDLQQFCQKVFLRCFHRLKLKQFIKFEHCSEVMLALLYGNTSLHQVPLDSWSPITRMLYSSLSGEFHLGAIDINPQPNKWHMLYKYEVLIKTAYCFNVEMSKHATLNLASITRSYIGKWIKSTFLLKDRISAFETEFIKMLLQYLEFNNFDKLVIELVKSIQSKGEYYKSILLDSEGYLLNALISLQMMDQVAAEKEHLLSLSCDLTTTKLEPLLHFLESKLQLYTWENDYSNFEDLFVQYMPTIRKEIYDIDNNTRMPASHYIKVLLFNVNLLISASKLHLSNNNMIGAVTECKKALKLTVSLLKKLQKLSQGSRLKLISSLADAYMCLIKVYVHVGVARDSEFYVKELSNIICELGEPNVVFKCLHFLFEYYQLTGQVHFAATALKKSNKTFDYIDGESNILGLTTFFFDNNEYDKLLESIKLFFDDEVTETFLPNYWRLEMGQAIDCFHCPSRYKAINDINKMNILYQSVLKQLEADPFFKNMFESLVVIPSCHQPISITTYSNVLYTPRKNKLAAIISASPRSSNMTPRGKNIKQKFDRAAVISNLEILKRSIEDLRIGSLKNEELSKIASYFSLALSLLSNLGPTTSLDADLLNEFALSELPRSMPLYYDKVLNTIGNEIFDNFSLLPLSGFIEPVLLEKNKLLHAQKNIGASNTAFNVISIDICPVTGNLLLSKTESIGNRKTHLRMPLNRAYTRDLDCSILTFDDARKELTAIIEESNASTAIEVTSSINTSEDRRKWWNTRYGLDRRMHELLSNIESCWFNSLKGFFSPEIIDINLLKEFKEGFNQILHENLPSRRQCGNPSMFMQIEDWIVELVMKLNPQDAEFVTMMEDLIYFILDILLFHGEENAYDEINISMIHVQLEELIRKFRSRLLGMKQLSHTFLVVSSPCHMFPWECLSFLSSISVTRIPSYKCLDKLLKKFNDEVFPEVALENNISMILNPHGDLNRTEARFSKIFRDIASERPESNLIINEKPDEKTFLKMLTSSSIFVYLGHGGGEQYARVKEIKKFDYIAPSFLLGCSSASMGAFGKLEPTGMVYSYLLGGCPLVLGNLWDVTDKDIDKFSKGVFEKIGFIKNDSEISDINEKTSNTTISMAVSGSREICHLKYLNGAAPVVYGLPMRFR